MLPCCLHSVFTADVLRTLSWKLFLKSCPLKGALRESCQTSVRGVLVATAAQHCLVMDAFPFWDCSNLQSSLLAIPFLGSLSLWRAVYVLCGSSHTQSGSIELS